MRQVKSQLGFLYDPGTGGGGWDSWDDWGGWGYGDDYWGAGSSWDSFAPSPSGGYRDYNAILPGYCPPGYYHPIEDPFNCVPFPVQAPGSGGSQSGGSGGGGASRPGQSGGPPAPAGPPRTTPAAPCPPPYRLENGRCVPPPCPEGQMWVDPRRQCETIYRTQTQPPAGLPQGTMAQPGGVPWWLWAILGGAVLIAATKGGR